MGDISVIYSVIQVNEKDVGVTYSLNSIDSFFVIIICLPLMRKLIDEFNDYKFIEKLPIGRKLISEKLRLTWCSTG